MKLALTAAVVFVLSCQAFGKNDWSKPCLDGTCSFDVEEGPTTMGGSIEISGSPSAISDITPAAGWQVLNCTNSASSQTISLVCTDENKGCGHLFQGGAQDTVIRLPENCGSGPFVRVANHWIPDDQSTPSDVASNLTRRDGTFPQVHILQIDDDFEHTSNSSVKCSSISTSYRNLFIRHGTVSFEIRAQGDLLADAKRRKRQTGSGFENEPPVSLSQRNFLFNDNITACPQSLDGSGTSNAILAAKLTLDDTSFMITVNLVSSGTMNPPSITTISFSAPTNAEIVGVLAAQFTLQGTVDAMGVQLANSVFPSFTIGGFMTINPSFSVVSNAMGSVQLQTFFNPFINFEWDVGNLQFTYPSNFPPPTATVSTPTQQFSLLMLPAVNSNVEIAVNILFELLVQVSAFSQSVDLTVTHNLGFDMEMQATPAATGTGGNNEDVCVDIVNTFSIAVANSGPFFKAFAQANSQTAFQNANIVVSSCQTVPLGPAPQSSRLARSSLYSRDSFSCPPALPIPQSLIRLQGSFP